jgi:WD40 repeat protein
MSFHRWWALFPLLFAAACGGSTSPSDIPPRSAAPQKQFAPTWAQRVGRWNTSITFAPTGEVVSVEGGTLRVHAAADGRVVRSAPLCWSADLDTVRFAGPRMLVAACREEWVVFSWPELSKRRGPRVDIEHAAIGPDRVAAISGRRRVRIWSLPDFALIDWFDVPGEANALSMSPDGGTLGIGTDEAVIVRNIAAQSNRSIPTSVRGIRGMCFSPDGRRLFAGVTAGAIEIDVASGGMLRSVPVESWVTAVRYLSDDVVVMTEDRGLYIVEKNQAPQQIEERLNGGLDIAADGSAFCAGGHDGDVKCFSARGYGSRTAAPGRVAALPKSPPPAEPLDPVVDGPRMAKPTAGAPRGTTLLWSIYSDGWRKLALTPTGDLLSASHGMLRVHGASDGRVTATASLCSDAVNHLSFAGPGRLVFVCEHDAGVASFPEVKVIASHHAKDIGPHIAAAGGRVAFETAMSKTIRVLAVEGWKRIDEFPIEHRLEDLTLSPDGTKLAYSLYGHGILLRDLETHKETVLDKDAKGDGLAFSANGTRLFGLGKAFQAVELDVVSGTQKRAWSANTWITEAHYLNDDAIVAVGAGGLTIFAGNGGAPAPSVEQYDSTVAVGVDAATFCASGAKGELACFRR